MMQHTISLEQIGAAGGPMVRAVETCVHCGFCLPACPTYNVLGQEMDSPRGRIYLMKEVLEGGLALDKALPYLDKCLGCVGCVTACPSGVEYGELISPFRALAEEKRKRGLVERLVRWMTAVTLPHPRRFRWAAKLGRVGRLFGPLVPRQIRPMLDLLPSQLPRAVRLPQRTEAVGERRARVALLAGCAQQVLEPGINLATIEVLAINGVEVVVPQRQVCCGALAWHTGDARRARRFARQNIRVFDDQRFDAVVTNAAGCGSGIHEYPLILEGTEEESGARRLAEQTVDISVLLEKLGVEEPMGFDREIRVAYHDACHLNHAQRVYRSPRVLLGSVPGVRLLEVPDGELCCGSAGTYNIDQPEIASQLGEEKAQRVLSVDPEVVVTGNIGCMVQIQNHLAKLGSNVRVMHTVQLLAAAYRAEDPTRSGSENMGDHAKC